MSRSTINAVGKPLAQLGEWSRTGWTFCPATYREKESSGSFENFLSSQGA